MTPPRYGPGIEVNAEVTPEFAQVLTPAALAFAARLQRAFGARRTELLARRVARQVRFDAGDLPDFIVDTEAVRGWLDAQRCGDTTDHPEGERWTPETAEAAPKTATATPPLPV